MCWNIFNISCFTFEWSFLSCKHALISTKDINYFLQFNTRKQTSPISVIFRFWLLNITTRGNIKNIDVLNLSVKKWLQLPSYKASSKKSTYIFLNWKAVFNRWCTLSVIIKVDNKRLSHNYYTMLACISIVWTTFYRTDRIR